MTGDREQRSGDKNYAKIFIMKCEEVIEAIVKTMRSFLPTEYKIFLFGSWARGDAHETSDIDIGILGPAEVPWETLVELKQRIDEIPTLRKIDVVDLNSKDDEFRKNVLKYAKIL